MSRRVYLLLTACCLLFSTAKANSMVTSSEELVIGIGEQRILSVPVGSDVGFTGPMHIVQVDPGRVKVIGDGPGWGSITVRSGSQIQQYSVQIVAIPPEQVIAKLRFLLAKLNLTFTTVGGQVVVEGRIETTQDLERFKRVMEAFPNVVNMVVIAAREGLIEVAVSLVEVDATSASGFGLLNIAPPTGAATLSGTIPISGASGAKIELGFAASSQLLSALNAQIQSGKARIIANPRIVTLNRKEAVITSGGEIPYRVLSATGAQGVDYKPYGITLRVTPEERMNDILLDLSLESSEPVGTVSGASENPLTSRSIALNVAVEKNKTLALAGLYNAVTSRATQSGCLFPLLAVSSSVRRREIVVLVTPRISPAGINQETLRMVESDDIKPEKHE